MRTPSPVGKYKVHSLICHRDVKVGCECLASLLRNVPADLTLHDDGTLTDEDSEIIRDVLPRTEIIRRDDADRRVNEILASHPNCRAARSNSLMLKLFDVALFSKDYIAYCDTDVFFFRPVEGLFDLSDDNAVFMQDVDHSYSVRPWNLWPLGSLRLPKYLNSGLFVFPRDRFDLDYCEWLLSHSSWSEYFVKISCWAEQTMWAALAFRNSCRLYDKDQIEMVGKDWIRRQGVIAAHFVSSYRHLMVGALRDVRGEDGSSITAERIRTYKAKECHAGTLGVSQIRRRLERLFSN